MMTRSRSTIVDVLFAQGTYRGIIELDLVECYYMKIFFNIMTWNKASFLNLVILNSKWIS